MKQPVSVFVVAVTAAIAVALLVSSPGHTQGTYANGDITAVYAGPGLEGGSAKGSATLGMLSTCDPSQVLRWDGDSWECSEVNSGSTSLCPSGTTVMAINSDGSPDCDVPDGIGGSVTAGANIDVSGSTVSVEPSVTLAGESNTDTLDVNNSATGQTSSVRGSDVVMSGTFNVTGGALTTYGVSSVMTSSKGASSGSTNAFTNVAGLFQSTNTTDVNYNYGVYATAASVDTVGCPLCSVAGAPPTSYGIYASATGDIAYSGYFDEGLLQVNGYGTFAAGASFQDASEFLGNLTIGNTSADTLTVNATTTHTAPTTVGDFRGTVQTATCGNNTSLTATTTILHCANTSALTGITGGTAGRVLLIVADALVTASNESGSSTAANRLTLAGGMTFWLTGQVIVLVYDGATSRWQSTDRSRFGSITAETTITASSTLTGRTDVLFGEADSHRTTVRGILRDSGTPPSVSSCGTSPGTPTGGSNWWSVVAGTGGAVTACTFTYSTKTSAPVCDVEVNNAGENAYISSVSATAVTITAKTGTTDLSGDTITVRCLGDG